MKREEKKGLPFFGIPKLAPYLKPYRMLFFWMVTMGGIGSAMDAVIPLFQQHAIDHFIAEKTMDGIGGFLALAGALLAHCRHRRHGSKPLRRRGHQRQDLHRAAKL